jgi:4'-phosphopantetheinyl transferase
MEHALSFAGCSARDIVITPQGKPTVKGCSFNLSHTADIAVCAISDLEVGIDIERPRTLSDAVIKRAFTPHEIEMVGDDTERFIRLWTIKESVMKWFGLGLSLMPEYIDVLMDDEIKVTILDHPDLNSKAGTLHFSTYRHDDYHITVCSSYENYAEQGFTILGVYSTEDREDEVDAVLAECGTSYPILHYCPDFDIFQSGYVPTTVFVDSRGQLVGETQVGALSYEGWAALVEALL